MNDIRRLLERQARWQRARKALPWPEKIRMVEMIRESASHLRAKASKENPRNTSDRDN
jgi:hypothetical protein